MFIPASLYFTNSISLPVLLDLYVRSSSAITTFYLVAIALTFEQNLKIGYIVAHPFRSFPFCDTAMEVVAAHRLS